MDGHKVPLDFYLSGDYKVRENIIYIIMEILPYIEISTPNTPTGYMDLTVHVAPL